MTLNKVFDLTGRVAIITGGAGLLGFQHAEVIAEAGGHPVLVDINRKDALKKARIISKKYDVGSIGIKADITNKSDVEYLLESVLKKYEKIDILINNAANNPQVKMNDDDKLWSRFENFPLEN